MRLFLAVCLDPAVKRGLCRVQDQLRAGRVGGSYTPSENLHLTLAFVGEYPHPDRVLEVLEAVPFSPFSLTLEGLGAFDDLYWCGVRKQEALNAYVRRLRHALAENGIPFDRKKFCPHITLLRRAVLLGPLPPVAVPPAEMTVRRVSLMRSDRGKNGMIYTEL